MSNSSNNVSTTYGARNQLASNWIHRPGLFGGSKKKKKDTKVLLLHSRRLIDVLSSGRASRTCGCCSHSRCARDFRFRHVGHRENQTRALSSSSRPPIGQARTCSRCVTVVLALSLTLICSVDGFRRRLTKVAWTASSKPGFALLRLTVNTIPGWRLQSTVQWYYTVFDSVMATNDQIIAVIL